MYIDKNHILRSINGKDIKNGTVHIPPRVKEIGAWAFSSANITSIIIPKTITDIQDSAFAWCANLKSIIFEEGIDLYEIGMYAFNGCKNLTKIKIPNSIKFMSTAFGNCERLESITFDKNCHMNSMWYGTFSGCPNLKFVTMPEKIDWVGGHMFTDSPKVKFNKYGNAKYLGNNNNPYIALIGADNKDIVDCSLHKDCKYILSEAFKGCKNLKTITFPKDIQLINVGNKVFEGCPKLKFVKFPNDIIEQGAPPWPHPERYKNTSHAIPFIPTPHWMIEAKANSQDHVEIKQ